MKITTQGKIDKFKPITMTLTFNTKKEYDEAMNHLACCNDYTTKSIYQALKKCEEE